ncbi:hypothetical protein WH47_08294 [Habropoda laboriosa]|uniref:Uncharacterized protein n=1 Tax=Habropoda laboriosa TaxID=597456 RepID=A0A0L7RGS8_9HYME|nr:hypothetical protein WH47_08294 [Habropoda laboriosa]
MAGLAEFPSYGLWGWTKEVVTDNDGGGKKTVGEGTARQVFAEPSSTRKAFDNDN